MKPQSVWGRQPGEWRLLGKPSPEDSFLKAYCDGRIYFTVLNLENTKEYFNEKNEAQEEAPRQRAGGDICGAGHVVVGCCVGCANEQASLHQWLQGHGTRTALAVPAQPASESRLCDRVMLPCLVNMLGGFLALTLVSVPSPQALLCKKCPHIAELRGTTATPLVPRDTVPVPVPPLREQNKQ